MNETFLNFGAQLAVLTAKGTAAAASAAFTANRKKQDIVEVCNSYEEIINELVGERSEAIAIAQAYENELKRFTISDEDIQHLQATVARALELLGTFSPGMDIEAFRQFESLISVDTLKAVQLLGFDYKAAIGDPLTHACANAIEQKLGGKSSKKK